MIILQVFQQKSDRYKRSKYYIYCTDFVFHLRCYDKRENMECQKDRHVDELDGEIGPLMRSASVDNGKRTVIRFSVTAPGKKATGFCQSVHQRC